MGLLDELAADAELGDFSKVLQLKQQGNNVLKALREIDPNPFHRRRAELTTTSAQFYFYLGQDKKAIHLLSPYARRTSDFLSLDLKAVQKLQLAEFFYLQRNVEAAQEIANKILRSVQGCNAIGTADCCYYLSRYHTRLNQYDRLDELRDLAFSELGEELESELIEKSALLIWSDDNLSKIQRSSSRINWRIARIFLASSFGHYRAGNPQRAKADAHAANHFLVIGGVTDRRGLADTQYLMGSVARLQADSAKSFEFALKHFQVAKVIYDSIELYISAARVLVDIARIYISMQNWVKAKESLVQADENCNRAKMQSDPSQCDRQRAEILLWQSILSQEQGDTLDVGAKSLFEAEKLVKTIYSPWLSAEINICIGNLKLKQSKTPLDIKGGLERLEQALDLAKENNFTQSATNAYLSLAEYHATFEKNIGAAISYHTKAQNLINPYTSRYIKNKESKVARLLRDFQGQYFLLTADEIGISQVDGKRGGYKELVHDFKKWCVKTTVERCGGDRKKAAARLGISQTAVNAHIPLDAAKPEPN